MAEVSFYSMHIIRSRSMNSVCFLVVNVVVVSIYIARSSVVSIEVAEMNIARSLYLIIVTKSTSSYLGSYSVQNLLRNTYPCFFPADLEETAEECCSMSTLRFTQ